LGLPSWEAGLAGKSPIAAWHGNLVPILLLHASPEIHPIVSLSKDGELLAGFLGRLGYGCIRGSSSRGGSEAYKEALLRGREGVSVAFALDGPRGPRGKAKGGAVRFALELERPLLLISVHAPMSLKFSSWDGAFLPLPWSVVELNYTIWHPRDTDLAENCTLLESSLNELSCSSCGSASP
jgi:lysophospholipid acyltransferase (LPLAT)-like uncharacterized protein